MAKEQIKQRRRYPLNTRIEILKKLSNASEETIRQIEQQFDITRYEAYRWAKKLHNILDFEFIQPAKYNKASAKVVSIESKPAHTSTVGGMGANSRTSHGRVEELEAIIGRLYLKIQKLEEENYQLRKGERASL